MVKPKLTLFQVQVEGTGCHAPETNESCFCMAPETFNAIDVVAALGIFILAMVHPEVLAVTNID